MCKGSGKIGNRKVLAKRLGVAVAVLIGALMGLVESMKCDLHG
jgi:hypothetical protein